MVVRGSLQASWIDIMIPVKLSAVMIIRVQKLHSGIVDFEFRSPSAFLTQEPFELEFVSLRLYFGNR